MLNNLLEMHLNLIQKIAIQTGNNIAEKIAKVSRSLPQNSSETIENETKSTGSDIEMPKERYISPKKR